MEYLVAAAAVLVSAGINRLRGMGISGSRVYASVAFGVLAGLLALDWRWGVAVGLGFLHWGAYSWGRWFDMDSLPVGWNREGDEPSTFEKAIESISFGSKRLAMFWRMAFGILPIGMALSWVCGWGWLLAIPVFAFFGALAYQIAVWIRKGKDFIPLAEILTGVVWGILLVLAVYFCGGSPWLGTTHTAS